MTPPEILKTSRSRTLGALFLLTGAAALANLAPASSDFAESPSTSPVRGDILKLLSGPHRQPANLRIDSATKTFTFSLRTEGAKEACNRLL